MISRQRQQLILRQKRMFLDLSGANESKLEECGEEHKSEFRKARHTQIIHDLEDVVRMWDSGGFE